MVTNTGRFRVKVNYKYGAGHYKQYLIGLMMMTNMANGLLKKMQITQLEKLLI